MAAVTITVSGDYLGIDTVPYQTGYPSLISMVGGGAADTFRDNSDSTYVHFSNGESTPPGWYGANYTGAVVAFPAIDIPAGAKQPGSTTPGVFFSFQMRARAGSTSTSSANRIYIGYCTWYGPGSTQPPGATPPDPTYWNFAFSSGLVTSTSWSDYRFGSTSRDTTDPTYYYDLPRTDVFRLGVHFFIQYWGSYPIDVSELSLTVSYDPPPKVAPPLRQFPRDDALATSSARRYWPTPRSVQRGTRRAGHTYP